MCGLAGILIYKKFSSEINFFDVLEKMSLFIKNRGPDSKNNWISEEDKIGMIHTRLSIVGIGSKGDQPIISKNGRYVMTFNGEIYNYKNLKNELSKKYNVKWTGSSDSEVLLEGISLIGFEAFIKKTQGMFAISVWDKKLKKLLLARDRMGEKPLYFGKIKNDKFSSFAFSSDIGSFTVLTDSKLSINKNSLIEFINNGWISGKKTIYDDIEKVMPGELLEVYFSKENQLIIEKRRYWNLNSGINSNNLNFSFEKQVDYLNSLLINVIEQQLYCERDKAIFFSGGIDSTLIAAISKKELGENITCITCGFGEELQSKSFDETLFAKDICANLEIPHITRNISSKDIVSNLSQMSSIFSEPFADISQVGTYLISKKARELGIIVALGGDGGDELFGGYERYLSGPKFLRFKDISPFFIINYFYKTLNLMPDLITNGLGKFTRIDNIKQKTEKFFFNYSAINNIQDLYLSCLSKWDQNAFEKLGLGKYKCDFIESFIPDNKDIKNEARSFMMKMDLQSFLIDDVLVKTDRSSMSVGLEARSPFLNHIIVDFANSIPTHTKFSQTRGKEHLRKLLKKYIDEKLINRPKKGFSIPIDQILRSSGKEWASEMINYLKNTNEFSLNIELIDNLWNEHLKGKRNHGNCLWNLIVLSSWMQVWRK